MNKTGNKFRLSLILTQFNTFEMEIKKDKNNKKSQDTSRLKGKQYTKNLLSMNNL